jgi:2-keto-4-pentenoate hydratase/2-oxohepta-3-ene-1,7-dioic acid hydratase in catechol pathway
MRLATVEAADGQRRAAAIVADRAIDLNATDPGLPASLRELLAGGQEILARAKAATARPDAVALPAYRLKAPISDPQKVICIGLNYRDHAAETGAKVPSEPVVFNKFPTAVIGPEDVIRLPRVSQKVDFEAELVVVIGRRGRNIPAERAIQHVAGYTCGHDVSARDWQLEKDGRQWLLGKTFDTFAPSGPVLVTRDEIADPNALDVRMRINGQTMQDSNTRQFIFRVEELTAYISQVVTLEVGDLIYTGTPPGVGMARKPPVFLQPGDVCEVEIEGIGVLRNKCVADE